jgi:predicted RND superfamily exporter protein
VAESKDRKLSAIEEAELAKATLYRLGASLLKNRVLVTLVATLLTAFMAYQALGMQMTTAFNDLLPYRHPYVQVHFKFANQFGGANNVNIMLKVDKGDIFNKGGSQKDL